jgi:hypothetical protein
MKGGPVTITADGVIGPSGKPIRVYGISIGSGAGGGGVVEFHNGTSTSGQKYVTASGTASTNVLVANIPAAGLLFPAGLYANVDANTTDVTAWIEVVSIS